MRLYLAACPQHIEFATQCGRLNVHPPHRISEGVHPLRLAAERGFKPSEVIASFPGPGRFLTKAANKLAFELLLCFRQPATRVISADELQDLEHACRAGRGLQLLSHVERLQLLHQDAMARGSEFGSHLKNFMSPDLWVAFCEQRIRASSLVQSLAEIEQEVAGELSTDAGNIRH